MANYVSYPQMEIIATEIKNNFDSVKEQITNTQDTVADEFNTSTNYKVGDIVIYGNKLYKCKSNHDAGNWNPDDFEETSISELINESKIVSNYNNENLYIH